MDISISSISNKVIRMKDTIFNYFGIEKILERQDPRYEELIYYAESITEETAIYSRNQKSKEENKTKAIRDAEECYRIVPAKYFEEDFKLTLARKKAQETKLLLSEYLDQVDVTLFSLVNANFGRYMGPMLEIEEIEASTEHLLKKIHKGRD